MVNNVLCGWDITAFSLYRLFSIFFLSCLTPIYNISVCICSERFARSGGLFAGLANWPSISEAFKIAEKTTRQGQEPWVINIFGDSQSIINNLRECKVGAVQALKLQIYQKTRELVEQGHSILIR